MTIKLIDVANHWGDLPHQQTAVTWLQKQVETLPVADGSNPSVWNFARRFRDNEDGSTINFVNVFNYYNPECHPHHNIALKELQADLTNDILAEFATRWRSTPPNPTSINLEIPWFPQSTPRTCFSASTAMAAFFNSALFRARFSGGTENAYRQYLRFLSSFGDTTDANSHVNALRSLGINAQFVMDMSLGGVFERLLAGQAVPMGIVHRGSMYNPTGFGHWFCSRGVVPEKTHIIVNDPWGSLNDGYSGDVTNGRNARYSRAQMNHRFTVDTPGKDSNHGWVLLIPIDK